MRHIVGHIVALLALPGVKVHSEIHRPDPCPIIFIHCPQPTRCLAWRVRPRPLLQHDQVQVVASQCLSYCVNPSIHAQSKRRHRPNSSPT
ncbi:hypothetical protein BCR44DRAFT_1433889 [Catenaria anguillulae PL171]|uniref:Secreted protein n=1 Tax=Catenaria anguillulae PL171 TaxID=765915 RepID=A0A1Y2HPL5_9FUNG|nr:hypothetical protein BCR44DRAFT_1433889 [Catenaria anguillulae PL171]